MSPSVTPKHFSGPGQLRREPRGGTGAPYPSACFGRWPVGARTVAVLALAVAGASLVPGTSLADDPAETGATPHSQDLIPGPQGTGSLVRTAQPPVVPLASIAPPPKVTVAFVAEAPVVPLASIAQPPAASPDTALPGASPPVSSPDSAPPAVTPPTARAQTPDTTSPPPPAQTADAASPPAAPAVSHWPQIVGAQYTFIRQHQTELTSPYEGPRSLDPSGDTQSSHTIGLYLGWAVLDHLQLYFDTEKFMGAGVSGAQGLAGLPNGDVIRQGAGNLPKRFYIARKFVRYLIALPGSGTKVAERTQDQLSVPEPTTRIEIKAGVLAANDDFDLNRYAGSTRIQFMNWSLWNNGAWDFAADTRGYTEGVVAGFVSPQWSIKYGLYEMPVRANQQQLESSISKARGENLELTYKPGADDNSTVIRALVYRNTARMGIYEDAIAFAEATGTMPDIVAQDREGRHKTGVGVNVEQPLADEGETGVFARAGWNDGKTESFAFTEVDRTLSVGGQLAGGRWKRPADRVAVALAVNGLSGAHHQYLADGGIGFLLGDGRLSYGPEEILEAYYRAQFGNYVQLSPDVQYIRDPGYNRDRGPVTVWGLRLHLQY